MNTTRIPAEFLVMQSNGYDIETYIKARRFLSDRGVSVKYTRSYGNQTADTFTLQMVNPNSTSIAGPTVARVHLGVDDFIEYLDAPSTLFARFNAIFNPA